MSAKKSRAKKLRELLAGDELIVAPGAYDGFSVKLIERAGFPAAYLTGSGIAAVHGKADVGLMTMTECVAAARLIAESSEIPLIADADTGYGGLVNVRRTVHEFENAGVAAIHLEDQVFPKRCASLNDGELVSREEMCEKINVAVTERRDPDFVIIARTDAGMATSFDESIERLKAYGKAGADVLILMGMRTVEHAKLVAAEVPGVLMYSARGGDLGPKLTHAEIAALGYRILVYSVHGLRLMAKAYSDMLADIRLTGDIGPWRSQMISAKEMHEINGVPEFYEFEQRHLIKEVQNA